LIVATAILILTLVSAVRTHVLTRPVTTTVPASGSEKASGSKNPNGSGNPNGHASSENIQEIYVYMCGAVENPGVYRCGAGTRVNAAVALAGGLAAEADPSQINLARKLIDGERIYIPKIGEKPISAAGPPEQAVYGTGEDINNGRSSAWMPDGRLNINLATTFDLDTLPGIGPAFAARILDARQQRNGFTAISQLADIPGIGPKTLAKLKPLICFE